jgi:hypothetical protein
MWLLGLFIMKMPIDALNREELDDSVEVLNRGG